MKMHYNTREMAETMIGTTTQQWHGYQKHKATGSWIYLLDKHEC